MLTVEGKLFKRIPMTIMQEPLSMAPTQHWEQAIAPGQPQPTHPSNKIGKSFLQQKMKFIKGAENLRPILGTQTFFGL